MIEIIPWEIVGFVAPNVWNNLVVMGEIIWKE